MRLRETANAMSMSMSMGIKLDGAVINTGVFKVDRDAMTRATPFRGSTFGSSSSSGHQATLQVGLVQAASMHHNVNNTLRFASR
jgi:hypothetical protein